MMTAWDHPLPNTNYLLHDIKKGRCFKGKLHLTCAHSLNSAVQAVHKLFESDVVYLIINVRFANKRIFSMQLQKL